MMNRTIFLLSIGIMIFNCSSVKLMEGQSFRMEKPYVREVKKGIDATLGQNREDYKARDTSRRNPHYAVMPLQYPEGINSTMIKLLEKEIAVLWENTSGTKKDISNESDLADACRKNEIDALVFSSVTVQGGKWSLLQKVVDPVNQTVYGQLGSTLIPFIPNTTTAADSFRQIEVYHDGKNYLPVKEMNTPGLIWESRPDSNELNDFLKQSVSGTLNIGSTSADTELVLDGVKISNLPLKNYTVVDGKHIAQFVKPGKKPVEKEFIIRGGETRNFFHQWEDDVSVSSLRVTSYPPGIRIAVDGSVKGETPYFENGLSRGKLSVEFLKENLDQVIVLGDHALDVVPGQSYSLSFPYKLESAASIIDFWNPTGGAGFKVNLGDGISMQKNTDLAPGWYGVVSDSILPDSVTITATLGHSQDLNGTFALSFFENSGKVFSVEVEGDRVSVYSFPSDGIAIGNYTFIKDVETEPRIVRFVTNRKKKNLKVYLGRSKVLDVPIDLTKLWRLGIQTRGEKFSSTKIIKSLKIEYPELIKQVR